MAVIKDGSSNNTAAVDSHGSLKFMLVDSTGASAGITIAGSIEVSNDVGNPLPVSGNVALTNSSIAVTGSFYQATQPVSLSSLPSLVAGSAVIGAVTQGPAGAQAWPVSLAALPALAAGTATIGKVDQGAAGVNAWPVNVINFPALSAGANTIGSVSQAGTWNVAVSNFPAITEISNDGGNPIPVTLSGGGTTAAAPLYTADSINGAAVSNANPYPTLIVVNGAAASTVNPLPVVNPMVTSAVTAVGAAAGAATLTLPAAGAGLFHYITKLQIELFATAARTAATTPVTVTTTNLPGAVAFSFAANAALAGTLDRLLLDFGSAFKSSAANTATTIVGPATTAALWRITAFYFTGP